MPYVAASYSGRTCSCIRYRGCLPVTKYECGLLWTVENMRWRSCHNWAVHGFVLFLITAINAKELYRKVVCEDEDLYLGCAPKSFLAIHNAFFTTDDDKENITCWDFDAVNGSCFQDIRINVNRRCSGLNNCTYNFVNHQVERKCQVGAVVVLYDCVRKPWLHRFCNTQITASEGYIMSPGYPQYYPPLNNCSWNIKGGEGQTVFVTALDLSMALPTKYYGRDVCRDSVSVMEGSNKLLTGCGETNELLKTVESDGNEMVIQLVAHSFTPASGFLFYFKLQGCSTPLPPQNGYLVYRNGSTAVYMCCRGFYFNDTLDGTRILHCNEHNRWNATLPHCISVEELKEFHNFTDIMEDFMFPTNTTENEALVEPAVSSDTFLEDIIIPTVILVALLVGNAIILYIILHIRRKQKQKQAVSEEAESLNTTHIIASPTAQGTNV